MDRPELEYRTTPEGLRPEALAGFFEGWPVPPTPERHLELLRRSDAVALALARDRVVGFATAHSDGVMSAAIPLLEVLPEYRRRGVGSELVRRLIEQLGDLYMVDLSCDAELEPFYRRLGFQVLDRGMGIRNPGALR